MKLSLLDMVQDILSEMSSDAVNSIYDSEESEQVANIIRTTYYELHGNRNWPNTRQLFQLDTSGTSSRPTHMLLPEDIKEIYTCDVKYNKVKSGETNKVYRDVHYMYPDEFLSYVNKRNSDNDDIDVILDVNGAELNIATNTAPSYWTSFDDKWMVFDSYDVSVEATLQNSKTQIVGYRVPQWSMTDTFVPELPVDAFPLLLAEAKSRSFISIKEIENAKVEQSAQKQGRWMARKSWRTAGGVQYPNYGRNSSKGRRTKGY